MLTVRNLSKTFANGVAAVRPTDLTVETGERLVIIGPSGSGKSTFLRLLVGLEDPTGGEIWKDGVRIDKLEPHRRGIGFLSQRPALYPHLTVRGNLESAERRTRNAESKNRERSGDSAFRIPHSQDLLRLSPLLDRYPHQLSGGEKQRVALAKLLLRECDIWLLDEPFANLDPPFRAEFRHDLHLLSVNTIATIILVSHDPIDASALGRRIGVFGDGVLRQVGTPDELRTRPDNRFVAFALGQFCFLDGTATGSREFSVAMAPVAPAETGAVRVPLPPGLATSPTGRRLSLGLRPDDVIADPNGFRDWEVVSAEPTGGGRLLTVAAGRHRLRAEWRPDTPPGVPTGTPPAVGSPWPWSVRAGRGLWFDGETGERL